MAVASHKDNLYMLKQLHVVTADVNLVDQCIGILGMLVLDPFNASLLWVVLAHSLKHRLKISSFVLAVLVVNFFARAFHVDSKTLFLLLNHWSLFILTSVDHLKLHVGASLFCHFPG